MGELEFVAIAAFGMEAIVVRELRALGYEQAIVEDGRVRFRGDLAALCRANLWLRCAERVQIVIGECRARDFDDLFDATKAMAWENWLPVDAKFPVQARCIRSDIRSVPNTQKMVKRAIVERLRKVYSRHWFAETGLEYSVDVTLIGDRALLTIDTTGEGLHKRGYRKLAGAAPLRETVAAALVKLSYWNRDRLLVDPFCGSGTIPIEAAMIGRNLAPGRNRSFTSEDWPQIPRAVWTAARQEVRDLEDRRPLSIPIIGTDREREAIKLSRHHARLAGVETDIHFERKDFVEFPTNRDSGILICNPPYGERLGEADEVSQLHRDMGELLAPLDTWSLYILTAAERFEREFGKRADRRRKLFNARIACTYYQYLGPRPADLTTETPPEKESAGFDAAEAETTEPVFGKSADSAVMPEEAPVAGPETEPVVEAVAVPVVDVVESATGEPVSSEPASQEPVLPESVPEEPEPHPVGSAPVADCVFDHDAEESAVPPFADKIEPGRLESGRTEPDRPEEAV